MTDDEDDDPEVDAFLREVARVDALPPPEPVLSAGDRLGKFSIVARLGHGGMGTVYEAEDETLGRRVALKLMRRTSDEARRRFLQEARAAAAVAHPNLVMIHEVGEADGRAFIVMERVRGTTLREAKVLHAAHVATEIARGLAAVHAAGIVHRDLKPDNIMIGEDGHARLVDFGIAKVGEGSEPAAMTQTGAIVGTPSYMSPEQARGEPVDARSDIYSFGKLVAELLPSRKLERVVRRCLADDRGERYADGRELVAALEARPRSRLWLVAGGVVLAALAIVGWQLAHRTPAVHGRPLLARSETTSTNPQALAAYRGGMQSLHDSMFFDAVRGLEHAVELDPMFAAAHLRLGLMKRFFHSQEEGRASFAIAVQQRAQLDDHDRVLLDAAEPAVQREPFDYAESRKRFLAALDKYPGDVELMYWLAFTYSELGEHDQLVAWMDRMAAIDPTASVVWSGRVLTYLYLGRFSDAREAAIECRRTAPTQGACAFELAKVLDDQGKCDELEPALRAWAVASPDEPRAPHKLGELLFATGRPREAVQDLFAAARARLPEPARAQQDAQDAELFAWHDGDFATLEKIWSERPPSDGRVAMTLIGIYRETGRDADALAIAQEYEKRNANARPELGTSDANLYNDFTGLILATLAHGGAITAGDFHRRRDEWVKDLEAHIGPGYRRGIWAQAFAIAAANSDDAREAVATMARYEPLPSFYWFSIYGDIGRALALGGRADLARPYLERATHRCLSRDPRDFAALGSVARALGDRTAACAAYQEVIARWGHATPRSLSLERAHEASAELHCAQP